MERRSRPVEFRAENRKLRGYAATFGDVYDLGMFEERIAPGAFDNVLGGDTRALYNHDPNHVLGRTTAGTLRLSVDERGLFSEIDPPESAAGLLESVQRGDIDQMSFGFVVERDEWQTREDGKDLRTILDVRRLLDVSLVTYPANPNTDVALRSLEEYRAAHEPVIDGQDTENSGVVVREDEASDEPDDEPQGLEMERDMLRLAEAEAAFD